MILRLIGAILFERNDEWQTSSRSMMVEAFARFDTKKIDPILSMTTYCALLPSAPRPHEPGELSTFSVDAFGDETGER
ncbi:hypothetical protein KY389_11220 [Paracoccus bogoriensis]|nr:hypothetical protein [Paracoccus bogoriensis]